jgi:putative heme-binding domain-containing protein
MKAKDKWFRGIDLLTGPDGNVFVADWSDSGECHDNDGVHRSSGRIYKIVYEGEETGWREGPFGDKPRVQKPRIPSFADLDPKVVTNPNAASRLETDTKFISYDNGDGWWSRMATRVRYENGDIHPMNGFFARNGFVGGDWRLLPQSPTPQADSYSSALIKWLKGEFEIDPESRLRIASVMQRLSLKDRFPIATALAKHAEDANDRQQPLMIWYGIEPAVAAEPMKGVELIREAKIPTVRRLVACRIAEMIEDKPEAVDALVALMKSFDSTDQGPLSENMPRIEDVLNGMVEGLNGFSSAKKPTHWDSYVSQMSCYGNLGVRISQLSALFGSGRAIDELIVLVKNADGDANARLNAFKSLTRSTKPELLAVIRTLINDKVLGTVARSALAAYDDPSIPKQLTGSWPERSQEMQAATVATLTSRAPYAKVLLEAVKAGKVPAAAISPFQARQIRNLGDEALTKLLTEAWGEIRDTPEAKKAEFTKWEAVLKPEALAKADKSKGRLMFTAVCSACHKMYGQGGAIGPELTGSDRRNLKYLLENILDPSAVVPADFRVSIFHLKDGRTLSGVIPEQTERTLTIQTPAERLTIERTQIVKQEQMAQSLMPEGLLAALGEENVLNLIAYLMGDGQVELPK